MISVVGNPWETWVTWQNGDNRLTYDTIPQHHPTLLLFCSPTIFAPRPLLFALSDLKGFPFCHKCPRSEADSPKCLQLYLKLFTISHPWATKVPNVNQCTDQGQVLAARAPLYMGVDSYVTQGRQVDGGDKGYPFYQGCQVDESRVVRLTHKLL